jgi:hypothetical protein
LAPQPALNVQRTSTVCRVGKCSGADLSGVLPRWGIADWLRSARGNAEIYPLVVARLDRAIQYSRDVSDGADRPRRTGYPACAGYDDWMLREIPRCAIAHLRFASRPGMTSGESGMTIRPTPLTVC